MTRSHAKNTHTQSILSQSERAAIRGETGSKRLGAESFKQFDACYLCLSTLSDPVSCTRGHMYCRECALSNLISQKASIEVQKREMAQWEARDAAEREEARRKARERVLSDFEKGMGLGLASSSSSGTQAKAGTNANGSSASASTTSAAGATTSTASSSAVGARLASAQLSAKDIEAAAQAAEQKAMAKIAAEQAENKKARMPSFWLPSLAPEAVNGKSQVKEKDVKLQTVCLYGEEPHPFSRKIILPVHLHYPPSSKTPHCPSCARELSNSTSSFLLSSRSPATGSSANGTSADAEAGRPAKKAKKEKVKEKEKEAPYVCGHVVCKTCVDTIVKPAKRCCVCEAGVEEEGMIPVGKEGTGFAAAGGSEVRDSSAVLFRMM